METRLKIVISCLIIVSLVLAVDLNRVQAADRIIKLGHFTDMTGPGSPELIPTTRGAAAYFADLNRKGGINGIKIDVEWVDTKYQLANALSGYERLKEKVQVFYINMSAPATALKEKFREDKLPCFFMSSATIPFWPPGWIYGSATNFSDDLAFLGDYLLETSKSKGTVKVALMFSDDTFGRSIYDGGVQYLQGRKIEIVAEEPVKMWATDATSQLLRVQKANPDYILCNFIGATQGVVLRDRLKLGIKIPLGTCHGGWADQFIKIAGAEASEGIIAVRAYGWPTEDSWGVKYANELIKNSIPEWREKATGVYVGVSTGMIISEAIRLASEKVEFEKLGGAEIKEFGFDRIRDFDTGGLTSRITYDRTDCRGGTNARLTKIVGGKPIVIKDWSLAPVCKPLK